ncbi:adenylate/guanylate cyclase domain-containing protein [Lichenifustis flavocetrariae]|uniref:Adenylate/guanylate cyclase domain-containing protein n=1 Tax=Lichenifustis flavocetrariae TaxID=2949735 RepID=A0AA41Z057_9HYPH|nr:adenylate/guanylate cyclase domain-containing protein [Lichenifustis flavocetrariae]MCW6510511.1 adenylate/guanylate cyclase domain-containing protein [Lichenifustis flavocetrariae]
MPSHALIAALPPELARGTLDYIDWLLRSTPQVVGPTKLVDAICNGLLALGLPLDRYRTSTTVVMADADSIGRIWVRGQGITETRYVGPSGEDPNYLNSPFYEAARTGTWVEMWLPETPDDRFGIVPELKASGYTHYLCMQFSTPPGIQGWLTVATKSPTGFTRDHQMVLALVVPVIGSQINMRIARLTLDHLLRTYVGDEPHRAILDGNVKRGQVSTIRSAILFADMRDSTGHTAEISAVEAVDLFNDFFDCLVPPIETRGGEVLKYIGDGLLAIFREGRDGTENAATRALRAAKEGIARVAAYNEGRPDRRPIELGIALHYGEAAYGNVGSGLRLDFTVIGRDVGLASRIGGLNARLAEPILMSSDFVTKLGQDAEPIGAFTVRGFSTPVAVFRPQ